MRVGAQSGVRLVASCSPFDVIPPPIWDAFKTAVMTQAKAWGLIVHLGTDDASISQAQQRWWQMQKDHAEGKPGG